MTTTTTSTLTPEGKVQIPPHHGHYLNFRPRARGSDKYRYPKLKAWRSHGPRALAW